MGLRKTYIEHGTVDSPVDEARLPINCVAGVGVSGLNASIVEIVGLATVQASSRSKQFFLIRELIDFSLQTKLSKTRKLRLAAP